MKTLVGFVASFVITVASASAQNAPDPSVPISVSASVASVSSVDPIRTMREFFRKYVRTLDHAIYLYNYRKVAIAPGGITPALTSSYASGLRHVLTGTEAFWKSFGKPTRPQDVLGPGLYLAADPIASRQYGGFADGTWALVRIEIPAGTPVFNLMGGLNFTMPSEVREAMSGLGCWKDQPTTGDSGKEDTAVLDRLFRTSAKKGLAEACRKAIQSILVDDLHIGLMGYRWYWTDFTACPRKDFDTSLAFVLIDPALAQPSRIAQFTSGTTDALAERIATQSLFLWKTSESSRTISYSGPLDQWVNSKSGPVDIKNPYMHYEKDLAGDGIRVTFEDLDWQGGPQPARHVEFVIPAPSLYPYGPTLLSGARSDLHTYLAADGGVLWTALGSKSVNPRIEAWIGDHLIGCGTRPAFTPAPEVSQ